MITIREGQIREVVGGGVYMVMASKVGDKRVVVMPIYTQSEIDEMKDKKLVRFIGELHGVEQALYGSLLEIRVLNENQIIDDIQYTVDSEMVKKIMFIYMGLMFHQFGVSKKEDEKQPEITC